MNRLSLIACLALSMMCLGGCGRLIDWGKQTFNQGINVQQFTNITKQYVRSAHAYSQLETAAMFDALWLSDEVRTAYVDTHVQRFGQNDKQRSILLQQQLVDNAQYISFYLLSLYSMPLAESDSKWAVSLRVNNVLYVPQSVKQVDLDPEFKHFFGKQLTRFKVPYLVKFTARTGAGNPIITSDVTCIELICRSVNKELVMQWNIDAHARVKRKMFIKRDNPRSGHLFDVYDEVEVEAE